MRTSAATCGTVSHRPSVDRAVVIGCRRLRLPLTWLLHALALLLVLAVGACGGADEGSATQQAPEQPAPANPLASVLVGQWVEVAFMPAGFLAEQVNALYTFRLDRNAVPPQFLGTGSRTTFISRPGGPVETGGGAAAFYWGLADSTLVLVFASGREERYTITVVNNDALRIGPAFGPGVWQRITG